MPPTYVGDAESHSCQSDVIMSTLPYVVIARDSAAAGMPVTGLTPTWVFLRTLVDGHDVMPPPISEIGWGQYRVLYDPETSGDASGQIDLGPSLVDFRDRFVDVTFFTSESRVTSMLDAAISTRSTYAGGAVASVTAPVTVGTIRDKSGYVLAPAGLASISVPSVPPTSIPASLASIMASLASSTSSKSPPGKGHG